MASNLSSIGFHFENETSFHAALDRLVNAAVVRLSCERGEYAIWRSRTGAEIWFHLVPEADDPEVLTPVGFTPFFEGSSECHLEVVSAFQSPGDNPLEGQFKVAYEGRQPGAGARSFAIDAVDYAAHCSRSVPARWRVRLCGFARNVKVHGSEAEYSIGAAPTPRDVNDDAGEDVTVMRISGALVTHTALINEDSGRLFHALHLRSADGFECDIVADPEVVVGELRSSAFLEVVCQMMGRVLD